MGLFLHKTVKAVLDRNKVAGSYFIAGACLVLIVANVAVFLLVPKVTAPLAILLSNIITFILMLAATRPLNTLLQRSLERQMADYEAREKEIRDLREKLAQQENANRELSSQIDTITQMACVPANVRFTFKVETMTFDKSGYIVKEEPLDRFINDPTYRLSDQKGVLERLTKWVDDIAHPGGKKVLYIGKYYIKASIGLDFTKIKFSTDGGVLTLFGVKFTKLNDLAIDRDPEDVEHCWLLNETPDGITTINQSGVYGEFTEIYSRLREKEADETLSTELDALCEHYTAVFRSSLAERFPGVKFCDHIEDSDATWYSLKEHIQDSRIYPIASNMFLMADVLSETAELQSTSLLS